MRPCTSTFQPACLAVLLLTSATAIAAGPEGAPCADEGARCQFTGSGTVWYGANDKWVSKALENGTDCNNNVFGDPIVGTRKACRVVLNPPRGQACSDEGGRCKFAGAGLVYYGAKDKWVSKPFENGTDCTNKVFGDPIVGTRKACWVAMTAPRGTACADEGARCQFTGAATVYYGAQDKWVFKALENGTPCTNDVFGDPNFGVRKQCIRDGGAVAAAPAPVVAPPPAPAPAPASTENAARLIKTDKKVYKKGEPIVVTYFGTPGNGTDWTNVVKATEATDEWGDWSYNSGKTGSRTVKNLEPGAYEARAYFNGSTELEDKVSFTVAP